MIATRRIRRLPQVVADAIAAGEVIERPASVVKELMENAIDAGAQRIDVDIDGGGLVAVQVVDDGSGIAADDLELAVMRHATSKISDAADLHAIATLGFRGEALASIAAVADLRIASRPAGDAHGSAVRIRAGEVLERGSVGIPPGTRVEVCELFASTPARLHFLKATASEAAVATRVAADLALAHPDLRITCHTDGRLALASSGGGLRDALRAVYGTRNEHDLVDVEASGDIAISGAISAPRAHRAARSGLVLVVNGRRVHNRPLVIAVEDAYRGLLPVGRHPFGVLFVSMDPASLDVNVHPTKREVRFSDERAVFAAVQRACWNALRSAPVAEYSLRRNDAFTTVRHTPGETPRLAVLDGEETYQLAGRAMGEAEGVDGEAVGLTDLRPLRTIGQSRDQWIVAEAPNGVVLVDPHAAHEKVIYETLKSLWSDGGPAATQMLLLPAVIECDATRMDALVRHAHLLRECGFLLEAFGPGLVRCSGIPVGRAGDAAQLVVDALDELSQPAASLEARRHRLAALVACHSAVRLGDRLDAVAQQRLLDDLAETPGGMTCPHGRPTVLVLSDSDLLRAFKRPLR